MLKEILEEHAKHPNKVLCLQRSEVEQVSALIEALKWYANEKNYRIEHETGVEAIYRDDGELARTALRELGYESP